MGLVEDAVDRAAKFVGPFVNDNSKEAANVDVTSVVDQALRHLQSINDADIESDPDAPYDASLAGVVYGLLDLITVLAILPSLSHGVAFSQRPKSVLSASITVTASTNYDLLIKVIPILVALLEQKGSGVQPLVTQRIFPDVLSALAELGFAPTSCQESQSHFKDTYERIISETPALRLLPILTTFIHQPLPVWLKPIISQELALVPLRQRGIQHTIEFLSLSYLSKNSQIPTDASGTRSQIPIPLEAVTQASRLLVLPPNATSQDAWISSLAPQLLALLDGNAGRELSRAAAQIIAGGILSKRTTGAPGTVGWNLFALPILQTIYPKEIKGSETRRHIKNNVIVLEQSLKLALKRLSVLALSYSHAGLLQRLVGPLLLPLWALLNYAKARSLLEKDWTLLPQSILSRYLVIACDARHVDMIATNLFWDGDALWTFQPGSDGGVEIRQRGTEGHGIGEVNDIFSRLDALDTRVSLLVSLLVDAKVPDEVASSVFLLASKRWLHPQQTTKTSLTNESDQDPLSVLADAKLSEALATGLQDQLARSPQHVIELMGQLIENFVKLHKVSLQKQGNQSISTKKRLEGIVNEGKAQVEGSGLEDSSADQDLMSFALSIVHALVTLRGFKPTLRTTETLHSIQKSLEYLLEHEKELAISSVVYNSATNLIHVLRSSSTPSTGSNAATGPTDPLSDHRATMNTIMSDLTSPEPPNRTWALKTLERLIQNPVAFPVVDVPSLTHMLLSASLADPESYVHTAAIPVLVGLALRAPDPVIQILRDAFVDIEEHSLKLGRGKQTEEKKEQLTNALDFRLRVGEVLNNICLEDQLWTESRNNSVSTHRWLSNIVEACLILVSRRGQRSKTLSTRTLLEDEERTLRQEGETAWGGPIPNLMEVEGNVPAKETAERDSLQKILQGWEATGIEEDVRIRASAASVLSTVLGHRLIVLHQPTMDAVVQMALLVLTMETSEAKAILRRASVLVIMELLRGLDALLEDGQVSAVGLSLEQREEVQRVIQWLRLGDQDELVRDHAANVIEGLETLEVKRLYKIRDEGLRPGPDLSLEGNLRGLAVNPNIDGNGSKRMIIEEID